MWFYGFSRRSGKHSSVPFRETVNFGVPEMNVSEVEEANGHRGEKTPIVPGPIFVCNTPHSVQYEMRYALRLLELPRTILHYNIYERFYSNTINTQPVRRRKKSV